MTSARLGTAIAILLLIPLLSPRAIEAQDVSRMLARVQADGSPVADLDFVVYTGGERRPVGTTGSSGLAVIEFGRVPLATGTRMIAFAITCDARTEILLSSSAASLPLLDETCRRTNLGPIVWARTERAEIDLTDRPRMSTRTASVFVERRSGFRAQVGPIATIVGGGDDPTEDIGANIDAGIGGEILVGYDAESGPGIGLAISGSRHGLQGVDEALWRWAVALEPRYTISRPEWRARPYLAARAARQSLDAESGAGLSTETGWSFGGGAGIIFPFLLGSEFDFGLRFERLSVSADGFDRSGSLFTAGGAIKF